MLHARLWRDMPGLQSLHNNYTRRATIIASQWLRLLFRLYLTLEKSFVGSRHFFYSGPLRLRDQAVMLELVQSGNRRAFDQDIPIRLV